MRDYYCNKKFYELKIDFDKKNCYSCCKALPNNIDIKALKKNPGSLFNTDHLIEERKKMIKNQRVESCESACWELEDKGLQSWRLQKNGNIRSHQDLENFPEQLDLALSGNCNLTCSYCCKEYSSAWRNDIIKNGNYNLNNVDDRYSIKTFDLALKKITLKQKNSLSQYKILEEEVERMSKKLKILSISGGEPFLYNNLKNLLERFRHVPRIEINTGLGLKFEKICKILEYIQDFKNVHLYISGESTDKFYEFNRYGNSFDNFNNSVELASKMKINFSFITTHSNLTVLDYVNFNKKYPHISKSFNIVSTPNFMLPYVLDDDTKNSLIREIGNNFNDQESVFLIKFLQNSPDNQQRANLEIFIKEFSSRRKINLDFFPSSLRSWLNLN